MLPTIEAPVKLERRARNVPKPDRGAAIASCGITCGIITALVMLIVSTIHPEGSILNRLGVVPGMGLGAVLGCMFGTIIGSIVTGVSLR